MEPETTTWSKFSDRGKSIVEEILASEERKKQIQKSWTARIKVWDPGRKVNQVVMLLEIKKIITEFTQCITSQE